jgi:release factor glutamine methyltransferase
MPEGAQERLDAAIIARAAHQPVAQITGKRLFWQHEFRVTRDTLDPRPETEILVQAALEQPFVRMLDLGTGTGCILISLLKSMPMAQGVGTDISPAALEVARENADVLGVSERAGFTASDWFDSITGRFDLIVSNPPYISADEMTTLSPDLRNWEPLGALSPGGDGLDAYRAIARGAGARLLAGGRILLEIGPTQGAAVCDLLSAKGFEQIAILHDLDGRDRVVAARKPNEASRCALS